MKYFVTIGLFIVGFLVGGEPWSEQVIPPWAFPMFLLPATIYLDHFAARQKHASKWTRYSTTAVFFALRSQVITLGKRMDFGSSFGALGLSS